MACDIDRSVEEQEIQIQSLVAVRKEVPKITANGKCHFCDEGIELPKLFCDGDCADDFEKYTTTHRRY